MTDYGNPDLDPDAPGVDTAAADEFPPGPDLHGDNLDGHAASRHAIESALTSLPPGTRTVEAKAAHIHTQLVARGWWLAKPDPGHDLVQVGPGQQVVDVPDGHTVDVRRIAIDGPGDQLVDPELSELAEVVARLEGLDPDARERVAAYLTDRYGPTPERARTGGLWTWPTPKTFDSSLGGVGGGHG